MEKIKKYSKEHPFLLCVVIYVVYMAIFYLKIFPAIGVGEGIVKSLTSTRHISQNLIQIVLLILVFGFLWKYKVVTHRGIGLLKSVMICVVPFLFYGFLLIGALFGAYNSNDVATSSLLWILMGTAFVGFSEEFLFRGLFVNAALMKFGLSKSGIWKTILASSVLFGLTHAINFHSMTNPIYVVIQIASAIFSGILYSAMYLRTGNIYVCVFLHTMQDFLPAASQLTTNVNAVDNMTSLSPITVIVDVLGVLVAIWLVRNSKIEEVQKNMAPVFDAVKND